MNAARTKPPSRAIAEWLAKDDGASRAPSGTRAYLESVLSDRTEGAATHRAAAHHLARLNATAKTAFGLSSTLFLDAIPSVDNAPVSIVAVGWTLISIAAVTLVVALAQALSPVVVQNPNPVGARGTHQNPSTA